MQIAEHTPAHQVEEALLSPEVEARIEGYLAEITEVEATAAEATPQGAVDIIFDHYKPSALHSHRQSDLSASAARSTPATEITRTDVASQPSAPYETDYQQHRFGRRAHRVGLVALGKFRERFTRNEKTVDYTKYNEKLLAETELGRGFLPFYRAALEMAPEISGVEIVNHSPAESAGPYAKPSFEDLKHTVHYRTDNRALEDYHRLRDSLPVAKKIMVEQTPDFGLDEQGQYTLALYTGWLHELGHTVLYQKYGHDRAAYNHKESQTRGALPVPYTAASRMLKNPACREYVTKHAEELEARYGTSEWDDIVEIQQREYRQVFSEKFSDDFAREVLGKMHERGHFG